MHIPIIIRHIHLFKPQLDQHADQTLQHMLRIGGYHILVAVQPLIVNCHLIGRSICD